MQTSPTARHPCAQAPEVQTCPGQHSALAEHFVPGTGLQRHVPATQIWEQQSELWVQEPPKPRQAVAGGWPPAFEPDPQPAAARARAARVEASDARMGPSPARLPLVTAGASLTTGYHAAAPGAM